MVWVRTRAFCKVFWRSPLEGRAGTPAVAGRRLQGMTAAWVGTATPSQPTASSEVPGCYPYCEDSYEQNSYPLTFSLKKGNLMRRD